MRIPEKFYADNSSDGWIDLWVADSVDNTNVSGIRYEGRITKFPSLIPECEPLDSTLDVTRAPGQYYYEIETQTGVLEWGWVVFREEGCRLQDVY